jgi:hypothetical protein
VPQPFARIDWASLIRRVDLEDVLRCPCGGRRRILSDVTEPDAVVAILEHLGLPARAPPVALPGAQLVKLDPSGSYLWARSLTGTAFAHVETGSGNAIYLSGSAMDAVDFGGGPLLPAGNQDVVVVKLDAAGQRSTRCAPATTRRKRRSGSPRAAGKERGWRASSRGRWILAQGR